MQSPPWPSLSVVVPVYNSEPMLPTLVQRLTAVLTPLTPALEIILVNDGSRDGSWKGIQALAQAEPRVRGIDLMRNYGQHNALLAGIRSVTGEVIITLDDDLQNPPEEIPKLLAALEAGADVVYGPPSKEAHGLLRILASKMTKIAVQEGMGKTIASQISTFRVFRTQLRESFAEYRSPYLSIDVLLSWATSRFAAVPVRHDPRAAGESQYTLRKLMLHGLNMMTGFTTWPLRMASIMGFMLTFFGAASLVFVLARFFIIGVVVPGFAFLAASTALFSGAQLFALGVIGEYLSRIHFRLMERPTYAIRSRAARDPAR
jgi:undecaprenyl-phosphate 4-deoxy-4-formamido-L-arabinose transferase